MMMDYMHVCVWLSDIAVLMDRNNDVLQCSPVAGID